MTNEIKELINNLIEYRNSDYTCKQPEDCLTIEDVWLLLDYITNLQEEINKLTAESTEWESKCYDLENRIDKAVEYLTDEKREFSEDCYYKICETLEARELLNILRGDE
ncbi:MAG: hypothetical protein J6T10_28245 [Methanobrevibacter sp.]|nr:hypothetical protein [Methanobrevibacter sp.]